MTITSYGYDGTMSEVGWATLAPLLGKLPVCINASSFNVATTSTNYGVEVAAGTAFGDGVVDVSDAAIELVGSAPSSGTRYDTVVLRRNWAGDGGVTTVQLVTGTSTKAATVAYSTPGVQCDYPLALVAYTSTSTEGTVTDLRAYGQSVPVYASVDALPDAGSVSTGYLAMVNTSTGNLFDMYVSKGTEWENLRNPGWRTLTLSSNVSAETVTPKYAFEGGTVHVRGRVQRASGADFLANAVYTIGTLPDYLAPSAQVNVAVPSSTGKDSVCRAFVTTAGTIQVVTGDQTGPWQGIDMTFLI